eukprot:CCRYP_007780-RA/>CCRYP_007780-RA protein AED:0.14 eAED:0.14 QI:0/-1/0/1/-1/1/1/0/381
MSNVTTLSVDCETASGVDAFVRDLDMPSKALLSLQDSVSTDVQTEVMFDCTEEKEVEESTEGWGKKFGACGDGLDTTCGDWHIEIKREKPEERNPMSNDDAKEAEATREESSKPTEINLPKAETNEHVTKELSPEKENNESGEECQENEAKEIESLDERETWLDQISSQAHGMCTMRSDIFSPKSNAEKPDSKETQKFDIKEAWSSLAARLQTLFSGGLSFPREATANSNQAEEKDEVPISKYTEMALNGDHEEVTVVTEMMEQEKKRAKENETEIEKSNMIDQMKSQAKSAWLSFSQKLTFLNKSPEDSIAAQGKSEDVSPIEAVTTDDLSVVKTEARSPVAKDGKTCAAEESGDVPEDIISLASDALSSIQDSIVEPTA